MIFLKAFTIVTLWMILSFFWVSLGQSKTVDCFNYTEVESWLKEHPTVEEWFRYYIDKNGCTAQEEEFFKTLAGSDALSTKLNQAKVKFDQFYVPVSHLLEVDWESVADKESQNIQSDLTLIDHSLKSVLQKMNPADQDYFRATVLLGLPSDYVKWQKKRNGMTDTLSRRINRSPAEPKRLPIHFKDVSSPPYERAYR